DVIPPRMKQPFITADADLRLEGLEIHWATDAPVAWSEAEQLSRCAVASTSGQLRLDHCRIVAGKPTICVGGAGRGGVRGRSHLITGELGLCTYWRPSPGGLRAEDCLFEGRVALSASTGAEVVNPRPAPLVLERNTFATGKALHLQVDSHPRQSLRQPLQVTARHNLVNSTQLVVLFGVDPVRDLDSLRPEDLISLLRSLVEWSEEANVYRRGSQFLVAGAVKQGGKQVSARIDSLARWHELWKLPPTRSVEGVIRFDDRPSATAALHLLAVDDPSG